MPDYRVQLVIVMSFFYLIACMFGDRLQALRSASFPTAHLRIVSPSQLAVEEGTGDQQTGQNAVANLAPFFFQAIPINSADKEMLITVKGIGPALAETIIAWRLKMGPFRSVEDLTKIPGVGAKRAASLATSLRFDEGP